VPGPGVPPPELLVLVVDPLDEVLDDGEPELDAVLAPPLDDDDALFAVSSLPPQATTMPIPKTKTTTDPLMLRS
jgi:hypothetical protein